MFSVIGRSAFIAITGVCLCISSPSRAAEGDFITEMAQAKVPQSESSTDKPVVLKKYAKRSRSARRAHNRKVARAEKAARTSASNSAKKARTEVADAAPAAGAASTVIPASVANAKAQWVNSPQSAADVAARGMLDQADNALRSAQADAASSQAPDRASTAPAGVVDSDQLSQIDRKLEAVPAPAASATPANTTPANTMLASFVPQETGSVPQETRPSALSITVASNTDSTWSQTSLIGRIFIAFGGLLTLASAARMFVA